MNETDRPLPMNRHARETRDQFPEPGVTAVDHLRHTLAVYDGVPDDRRVVTATNNIYGDSVETGLDFGDLRTLLHILTAVESVR